MYQGNAAVGELFQPYLWGARGIDELVAKRLNSTYGAGLRFVLVEFYVFGGIDSLEHFPKRKLSRYAAKQMAIRSMIPVLPGSFHERTSKERAVFVGEALAFSVAAVKNRLAARFPAFDFDALEMDTARLTNEYLQQWQ